MAERSWEEEEYVEEYEELGETDELRDTPLLITYQVGHKDTVALLIEAGAEVTWGWRPVRRDPAVRMWKRRATETLKAAREELKRATPAR